MKRIIVRYIGMGLLGCVALCACKKWDGTTEDADPQGRRTLLQQIRETPELSSFYTLLTKSGYDTLLASSQNYTVFAPVNAALTSLDPSIGADANRLRSFVGNHITHQVKAVHADSAARVLMINGKYNNLHGLSIEEAAVTGTNRFAKNGFLQVIDLGLPVLPDAWTYMQSAAVTPTHQKEYLLAQVDASGRTRYLREVYDLSDERRQFTFFVLADAAWDAEVDKYKPFYVTGTADSTANLSAWSVATDLVVPGVYTQAILPDTLLSVSNTKIGIGKNDIVHVEKVSNGIVYVMSRLEVKPAHKFKPYVIQGENYQFSKSDKNSVTYIREKFNPLTGLNFRDVLVWDHNVPEHYLGYRLRNVPSMQYRAYWVAINDSINNSVATFKQRLGIGEPTSTLLPVITVNPKNYGEVYLGTFALPVFKPVLNIHLTADNSTLDEANKITVDYIRLEPVIN